MNRLAIFAHYDKDNTIHDYVVYYLKELKKVVDKIIFVSDSDVSDVELDKIKKYIFGSIIGRHGEYDFGSYKRGYLYSQEHNLLSDIDEIFFINDSCLGPFEELEKIFLAMSGKNADFWGLYSNNVDVLNHVQSFFLAFKSNVFKSQIFDDFMKSITKIDNKEELVEKYEIGLSQLLLKNGFKMESYIQTPIPREINGDIVWGKTMPPLIKTCAIKPIYALLLRIISLILKSRFNSSYPFEYMINYSINNTKILKMNIRLVKKLFIRVQLKRRRVAILGYWFKF